ncbi:MAG: helix-turn-helix domain-containing protein [Atopobiaceae bacterium]|jgi:hypothetical protein
MPRARFSDILSSRRRSLGLSIGQAAQVLKLRPEVLEAFEEGDFESIPKSGYAQGMLASYARYLDLDPQEIVGLFTREQQEWQRRASSDRTQRTQRTDRQARSTRTGRTTGMYGAAPLTPAQAHPYTRRAPGQQDAERAEVISRRRRRSEYDLDDIESTRVANRRSYRAADGYQADLRVDARGTGEISTLSLDDNEYEDDLRFDTDARSYRSASTQEGSRASRNISSTARPNVRRREQQQRGSRNKRKQGFFADPVRALVTVGLAVVLILTVVIILSVRSCVSGKVGTDTGTKSVSVSTANTSATSSDSEDDATKAADAAAQKQIASQGTTTGVKNATNKEVEVTVSVAEGQVTWLEITNGDTSEVADTIDGPWEGTYTVTDTLTVRAGDTTAVTVTSNGVQVPFESRISGIGTLTIKGGTSDAAADGSDAATGTDGAQGNAEATEGQASTQGVSSNQSATGTETASQTAQSGTGGGQSQTSGSNAGTGTSPQYTSGASSAKMGSAKGQ